MATENLETEMKEMKTKTLAGIVAASVTVVGMVTAAINTKGCTDYVKEKDFVIGFNSKPYRVNVSYKEKFYKGGDPRRGSGRICHIFSLQYDSGEMAFNHLPVIMAEPVPMEEWDDEAYEYITGRRRVK